MINSLKESAVILQPFEDCVLSPDTVNMYLDSICVMEADGAGRILICDQRDESKASMEPVNTREESLLDLIKHVQPACDVPVDVYQVYHRFEDVKKVLYAGAATALICPDEGGGMAVLREGLLRFGTEKVGILIKDGQLCASVLDGLYQEGCRRFYVSRDLSRKLVSIWGIPEDVQVTIYVLPCETLPELIQGRSVLSPAMDFSRFKTNSEGLVPVIVQDYQTSKVLMLAYMNAQAYQETLRSGRMTYYSRSRKCLWKKGETSGHYQYVKSLDIDCDYDTILARVAQVGAACHTGHESCFFTELAKKEYNVSNPSIILEELMETIRDRKVHPKEGSYTNYLFDKGIDKILKKVGEEATEIVIAAKNPDKEELKYEISDFLYHVMVLMVQKDLTWDEVMAELHQRH